MWTIAVVLVILWLLGLVCGYTMGNFIERLWHTLKYEKVYLKNYETVQEVKTNIASYFHFYNTQRLHQSLNYKNYR